MCWYFLARACDVASWSCWSVWHSLAAHDRGNVFICMFKDHGHCIVAAAIAAVAIVADVAPVTRSEAAVVIVADVAPVTRSEAAVADVADVACV